MSRASTNEHQAWREPQPRTSRETRRQGRPRPARAGDPAAQRGVAACRAAPTPTIEAPGPQALLTQAAAGQGGRRRDARGGVRTGLRCRANRELTQPRPSEIFAPGLGSDEKAFVLDSDSGARSSAYATARAGSRARARRSRPRGCITAGASRSSGLCSRPRPRRLRRGNSESRPTLARSVGRRARPRIPWRRYAPASGRAWKSHGHGCGP